MDLTDFQGSTTAMDREIDSSIWKGFAISEIALYENIDPEEISSTFDLPCFIEFTQEKEKIQHRIYAFLHKGKTCLYDFSYWTGDERPLYNKEVETTKIPPTSEDGEFIQFDIHTPQSEDTPKTVWVEYSKKGETLQIVEPPSTNPGFTITDAENIEHANKEAQEE